jgi:CHAT domain-containing protein/Tfp pilus assembly protein PilF
MLAALILFSQTPVFNSERQSAQVRKLETGKPVEQELKGGQSHTYEIAIKAGQYLSVIVEQRGIDVEVEVIAPDGKQLMKVDSPNEDQGEEPVKFIAESAGNYRLIIRPLGNNAPAGKYEIRLTELRAATENDRKAIGNDRDLQEFLKLDQEVQSLLRAGKYPDALPPAKRSLEIRERILGPKDPLIAESLNSLAEIYRETSHYAEAEILYKRALEILEEGREPQPLAIAGLLNNLALLYVAQGGYEKAEPLYKRALKIYEDMFSPEHLNVTTPLNNLAQLHQLRGYYAEAETLYKRALEIRVKKLGLEHAQVANSFNNLATLYLTKGDYENAEPLYKSALEIREKIYKSKHPDVATSFNNLAALYKDKGDYVKAEAFYLRALKIYEETLAPGDPLISNSLNNLGLLYLTKGDYERAESLLKQALKIREEKFGPKDLNVATSLNNLASLYKVRGDYERAEQLLKRALKIREEKFGSNFLVAQSINSLAELYRAKGDYADAEMLYKQALTIFEKAFGTDHPLVAILLNNLGLLYKDTGAYEQAESFYQRALPVYEKIFGTEHPNVARLLSNLSFSCQAREDIPKAIAYLSRAHDIREHDFLRNLASGSERQKLVYINQSAIETDAALSLHINLAPKSAEALQLAVKTLLRRKGRALDAMTDAIAACRRRTSPEDQKLLDQLASTRSQLAVLTLRGPVTEGIEKHHANLKALEEEVEKLEAEISSRSAEFRAGSAPITLDNVQKAIPPRAALVEFFSYRPFDSKKVRKEDQFSKPRYVAYVIRNQGEPMWVELGDAASIDEKIASLRNALMNRRRNDVKRLARALERRVMQPVRKLLGRTRRVFLSPDGALNLIPFAALVDERNHYLVERYSFTYLTSGRDLLRLKEKIQSKSAALVVADPDFGEDAKSGDATSRAGKGLLSSLYFSRLKHTEREATGLKALFPQAEILTQAKATEAALKQATSPQILHIATHGFFLRGTEQLEQETAGDGTRLVIIDQREQTELLNPLLRSWLGLAGANTQSGGEGNDGILTALEAAGLDLWGTKLVVLSACDTGVGEVKNGDGVYGLRRALVLAGSESQMMSLWPVSDRGTRDLMIEYYKRLKVGQGRSEALRQVQLMMLKLSNRRHPFYWASFIQSGEWANLDGERID